MFLNNQVLGFVLNPKKQRELEQYFIQKLLS